MKIVSPIYMQDYAPGFTLFTRPIDGGFLSDGIIWFENQDEVVEVEKTLNKGIFPSGKGFSHVVGVINETQGIEATEKGIWSVELKKYLSGKYFVICREPEGWGSGLAMMKITNQKVLIGHPYDFTTYPQFMVNALFKLQEWIPGLKKYPPLGHLPGSRVCSTLEAGGFESTKTYDIFKEWNFNRFHVHRLWNLLPYKPFRFDKQREGTRIHGGL